MDEEPPTADAASELHVKKGMLPQRLGKETKGRQQRERGENEHL